MDIPANLLPMAWLLSSAVVYGLVLMLAYRPQWVAIHHDRW